MTTFDRIEEVRERLSQLADPMTLLVGLFDRAPIGLQIYRSDGHCILTNAAFRDIFGAEPPPEYNLLRDPLVERMGILVPMQRALAGETLALAPFWYDTPTQPLRRGPGRRCAVTLRAFPLFDGAGKVAHVAFLFEDVTAELEARQRAEAERDRALEMQRRLQAFLDNARALVLVKDLEGRYLIVNKEAQRVLGVSAEEAVGKTTAALFGASFAAATAERERLALERRTAVQELEELPANGGAHRFLVTRFPILAADGQPEALGLIAIDIRDKAIEEQLRQSEARFSTVFQALPMGALFSRQSDRRFVEINAAWERLTGYSRAETLGRTSMELGLWVDPARREVLFQQFRDHGTVRDFSVRLRQKSGSERDVLLSMDSVELFGEPCLLLLAHDVTDLRQLERELRQSQKMEAIGRLAGGLAHDFNNILTAINGADTLLLDGLPADDPLRPYAEQIKRSTMRAAKLTQQLLTFTRKQPVEPVVLDPNEIVRAVVDMLQRMIGADIALGAELGARGRIKAEPGSFEQVILNLAVNARDAMPSGGTLTIRTADVEGGDRVPAGAWVMLEVVDSGIGMDAQTRARLFEPFFTTKEQGKGTGLGLSTVYAIVTQFRGHIVVDSAPGRGSTFRIYLPRQGDAPLTEPSPPRIGAPPGGRETVMLVEDDEDVRGFLVFILNQLGYRVLEAVDGVAALELAGNFVEPIDLVLSDIVMPRMDGIELTRRLTEARPGVKLLLMSGYPGDAAKVAATPAHFLKKPFERDELARAVRNAIDGGAATTAPPDMLPR